MECQQTLHEAGEMALYGAYSKEGLSFFYNTVYGYFYANIDFS